MDIPHRNHSANDIATDLNETNQILKCDVDTTLFTMIFAGVRIYIESIKFKHIMLITRPDGNT